MEQRSAEWFQARAGKVTASRVSDVVARTKTGWGASRANYAAQLVAERLTGTVEEGYSNSAMQWGTDKEPEARAAYEWYADATVEQVGFIPHFSILNAGASPDGTVGTDGLLELKCPNTATHIETLLGASVPAKYLHQMQFQMACTGRKWCDFASFDPRLPEHMRLWVKRVPRDQPLIDTIEADVRKFLAEVDETVAKLRDMYERREAAE